MGDPQFTKYPDLHLSQHIFHITNPSSKATQTSSLKALQNAFREYKMAPLYRHLAHPIEGIMVAAAVERASSVNMHASNQTLRRASSSASTLLASRRPSFDIEVPWDEKMYEELRLDNERELEAIQKEEDEATENAGETEIQAARGKRAEFWTRVGDKVLQFKLVIA